VGQMGVSIDSKEPNDPLRTPGHMIQNLAITPRDMLGVGLLHAVLGEQHAHLESSTLSTCVATLHM
jgi:hypothetical protein